MRFDEWQDSNGVPVLDGTGGGLQLGKILNVLDVRPANFSTSSTSDVDVTGSTISITPASATSKFVLIFTGGSLSHTNLGGVITFTLSGLVSNISGVYSQVAAASGGGANAHGVSVVDSPATTSARTYVVRARTNVGTATLSNLHFTVMEVAS
jgi:CO dehydrogenase/acetyl-CoA synthase alpha subunit